MEKFIQEQIDIYNNKKYNLKKIISDKKKVDGLFVVEIKSNKIYADISNDFMSRKRMILLILSEMLDRHKLKDTILLVNIRDGYYWQTDLPVFSFSVPQGKKGLIFPNFDMCHFDLLNTNYDEVKNIFKKFNPDKIKNDMYFKGGPSSEKKTKIREKKSAETHPFDVSALKDDSEPIYKIKEHKNLLDLPV